MQPRSLPTRWYTSRCHVASSSIGESVHLLLRQTGISPLPWDGMWVGVGLPHAITSQLLLYIHIGTSSVHFMTKHGQLYSCVWGFSYFTTALCSVQSWMEVQFCMTVIQIQIYICCKLFLLICKHVQIKYSQHNGFWLMEWCTRHKNSSWENFWRNLSKKKNNLKTVKTTLIATVGLLLPLKEKPRRTMHVQVLFWWSGWTDDFSTFSFRQKPNNRQLVHQHFFVL